ncbi:ribonuclease Z [Flagellimonas sp. 389]|uniref:ribonuclease Z n=1 Tax=Flagellimonas sp. 389 TaxID=2835862 RepID=UPI001BD4DC5D|nr:ribonuclease Z [Flagellimonas sp. 389]MBS9463693.1 ribonuclease Z [Flagellimonas sp. 389]
MIFDKEGTTTTVFQENISISAFLENFKNGYAKIKHDNIILNLFSFDTLTSDDILEFLVVSNTHKASGKSFILVTDKVSYDEIPEEINLVPSIQEAKDIIEMEEIERDLGI